MYRIGEFSRITRLPVKTLHHYDEIGLLSPTRLPENGYRLYARPQVAEARLIVRLKSLGCGLREIRQVLAGRLSLEALLARHATHLQEQSRRYAELAALAENWLEETGNEASYPVQRLERSRIGAAAIRGQLDLREVGNTFRRLLAILEERAAVACGPGFMLFFGEAFSPVDADVAVCLPVEEPVPGLNRLELPAAPVLQTVHRGPYERIGQAYQALIDAAHEAGQAIAGPVREVFLVSPLQHGEPPDFVTEIQLPVERLPLPIGNRVQRSEGWLG